MYPVFERKRKDDSMEYTVQKLGKLAGVSSRTLRYYDEIGLLKPSGTNHAGYRLYGAKEVDRLQQILFYRELGISLENIKDILDSKEFNDITALKDHREKLLFRKMQIEELIANVEKTIVSKERGTFMSDKEKFEGFKEKLVSDNEKKYGKEVREKYGDKTVDESNRKMLNMTEEQYKRFTDLSEEVISLFEEAYKTGDPSSEIAQQAADKHRQWLSFTWNKYSKEAHAGLAQMYVDDERFGEYYERNIPGLTKFIRDAIVIYTRKP